MINTSLDLVPKLTWRKKKIEMRGSSIEGFPFSTLNNLAPYNFTPYFLLRWQFNVTTY